MYNDMDTVWNQLMSGSLLPVFASNSLMIVSLYSFTNCLLNSTAISLPPPVIDHNFSAVVW